jgi:hypothetical protein
VIYRGVGRIKSKTIGGDRQSVRGFILGEKRSSCETERTQTDRQTEALRTCFKGRITKALDIVDKEKRLNLMKECKPR